MDLAKLNAAAAEQFARHGLAGWSFGVSTSKRRLGVCKFHQKRIEISVYYAAHNPDGVVLDTLMHEIAHALAGPKAGHGPQWQRIAQRIGATPQACDRSSETIVEPGDWQATCSSCRRTHHRYKRPRTLDGYRCRCPARSPIVYAWVGDSARMPAVPPLIEQAARWQARCAGCGAVHRRIRRPGAGKWLCRCAHRSELTWEYRAAEVAT